MSIEKRFLDDERNRGWRDIARDVRYVVRLVEGGEQALFSFRRE